MFILDGSITGHIAGLASAGGLNAKQAELNQEKADLDRLKSKENDAGGTETRTVSGGDESTTVETAKPQDSKASISAQVSEKQAAVDRLQIEVDTMRENQSKQGDQRNQNRIAATQDTV